MARRTKATGIAAWPTSYKVVAGVAAVGVGYLLVRRAMALPTGIGFIDATLPPPPDFNPAPQLPVTPPPAASRPRTSGTSTPTAPTRTPAPPATAPTPPAAPPKNVDHYGAYVSDTYPGCVVRLFQTRSLYATSDDAAAVFSDHPIASVRYGEHVTILDRADFYRVLDNIRVYKVKVNTTGRIGWMNLGADKFGCIGA